MYLILQTKDLGLLTEDVEEILVETEWWILLNFCCYYFYSDLSPIRTSPDVFALAETAERVVKLVCQV